MKCEIRESLELLSGSAIVIMAVVVNTLLCGCTRTVYEPMERVYIEYREADTTAIHNRLLKLFESRREKETRSDSLVDRTKETVVLRENGDTARHDRERIVYVSSKHERELEHKVKELDSINSALRTQLSSVKVDSIPVPYPVEKKLTRWEQTKIDYGGTALGAWLAVIAIAVIWLIKKFRK